MTRYSVQPIDRIFAKGYGFLSFAGRVSNTSPKNNSETNEEEILRERLIPPELRHKVFNDLRSTEENY